MPDPPPAPAWLPPPRQLLKAPAEWAVLTDTFKAAYARYVDYFYRTNVDYFEQIWNAERTSVSWRLHYVASVPLNFIDQRKAVALLRAADLFGCFIGWPPELVRVLRQWVVRTYNSTKAIPSRLLEGVERRSQVANLNMYNGLRLYFGTYEPPTRPSERGRRSLGHTSLDHSFPASILFFIDRSTCNSPFPLPVDVIRLWAARKAPAAGAFGARFPPTFWIGPNMTHYARHVSYVGPPCPYTDNKRWPTCLHVPKPFRPLAPAPKRRRVEEPDD